jgi:hypothetical protein
MNNTVSNIYSRIAFNLLLRFIKIQNIPQFIPDSRDLLEKPVVSELLRKFPSFYGT